MYLLEVDLFHHLIHQKINIKYLYMNNIYKIISPPISPLFHHCISFFGELLVNYFSFYPCILL